MIFELLEIRILWMFEINPKKFVLNSIRSWKLKKLTFSLANNKGKSSELSEGEQKRCRGMDARRMFVFSAHDFNMSAMFSAFGLKTNCDLDFMPYFAAALLVELWYHPPPAPAAASSSHQQKQKEKKGAKVVEHTQYDPNGFYVKVSFSILTDF